MSPKAQKLLRLALNHAAGEGEWKTAAVMLVAELRQNNVEPDDFASAPEDDTLPWFATYRMPFGKHKGKELWTLSIDYLWWIKGNITGKPDILRVVGMELTRRENY